MKIKLFKLIALLCIPVLIFCGCSKKRSTLQKVNASIYLEPTVEALLYNTTKYKEIQLSDLLLTDAEPLNADSFVELKLTANNSWIYKMYIDKIYFYVYTNEASETEMIVNITITNLADEDDIKNPSELSKQCSFIPKKNGSTLCSIDVNKTVATATGCNITFDIYNSTSGTIADSEGNKTSFKWLIYGLEIYGEHRTY